VREMKEVDVVVVGGGSTGCSILYNLAKRGVTSTLLVDKGPQPAWGQTGRSTALIRTHYTVEAVARMALKSYNFFRNFERELGGRTAGYVETGLIIGTDEASIDAVKDSIEMFHKLGIISDIIEAEEVKRIEPQLNVSVFSAFVYEPHMGYAEPSTTTSAFLSAAREMGADSAFNTSVTSIKRQSDGYLLNTSRGEIHAGKVVLATGVWSKSIFRSLEVEVPIKVVRHPVAIYRRPYEYSGKRPVVLDIPRSAYYKPEGAHSLYVGSLELELDLYGSEVDPDNYQEAITFDEVSVFSEKTATALPVMGEKGLYQRGYAGAYDNTPDQQPIIDELSDYGYRDIFCLVGLSGHGFKLCPEFGRIMASMVVEGTFRDYDVSIFGLGRFEKGRLLKGRYNVSTIG
jgi:sarcosine oxidase subunit beta